MGMKKENFVHNREEGRNLYSEGFLGREVNQGEEGGLRKAVSRLTKRISI